METACNSSHGADRDPIRDLNNYLQGRPGGTLAHLLSWAFDQSGPDHQKTHYATAKLNGREIGSGKGCSINLAKREAAARALSTLRSDGI